MVFPADKTDNSVGIAETLIATSAAGVVFALCAGQPLVIVGTTGPLLLFDESLYAVSKWDKIYRARQKWRPQNHQGEGENPTFIMYYDVFAGGCSQE